MSFHVPHDARLHGRHLMASTDADGNNGAFWVLSPKQKGRGFWIVASDGAGSEHVSVHAREGQRELTPTWADMCFIKALFWDDEDVVVQFHPRASEYVNCHEHTLHLWRPTSQRIPTPPSELVGPRVAVAG